MPRAELFYTACPRRNERIHHRRYEHLPSPMRLEEFVRLQNLGIGLEVGALTQRGATDAFDLRPHLLGEAEQSAVPKGIDCHRITADRGGEAVALRTRLQDVANDFRQREDR